MPRAFALIAAFFRRPCLLLACLSSLLFSGCSHQDGNGFFNQMREGKPQEFLQTSVDRMATLAMRDNLSSLYRLQGKLLQQDQPRCFAKNANVRSRASLAEGACQAPRWSQLNPWCAA